MKVFVLDEGRSGSYLLTFPKEVTQRDIKDILDGGDDGAAAYLLSKKSDKKILIPAKARMKTQQMANFTLAQGYSAERLA